MWIISHLVFYGALVIFCLTLLLMLLFVAAYMLIAI